jgi:hypothetical protein
MGKAVSMWMGGLYLADTGKKNKEENIECRTRNIES